MASEKEILTVKTNVIKPCPFCGGEASEKHVKGVFEGYNIMEIRCNDCTASAKKKDWQKRLNKEDA